MDIEYIKKNYIFEKLNELHNLDDFECEIEDLAKFLKVDPERSFSLYKDIKSI